jgi:hypothetical protein
MRILAALGLAFALVTPLSPAAAEQGGLLHLAQYGGAVTCRLSPESADRYTGGNRDCRSSQIGPDGTCYCPSRAGPIPGNVVGRSRAYRGYSEDQEVRCRVSPEASRYRGGNRDCNVRRVGRGGTCYCPSSRGPLPGVIVEAYD